MLKVKGLSKEMIDCLEGRTEITEEQFEEWAKDKDPYYVRNIRQKFGILDILQIAKENGCECYITPADDAYNYGHIIFPDGVVMYVQNGYYGGYDFCISYIPSSKNGTGCMCNEESISVVDWNELLKQKRDGLNFARKLKAELYPTVDEWKRNSFSFDKMVRL